MSISTTLYTKLRNHSLARRIVALLRKQAVVEGYKEYLIGSSGRALVSYFPLPLMAPSALRDRTQFSNNGIAQSIPEALNRLGFVVDIISCQNDKWLPKRPYDIFVGHTARGFERIADLLPPDCVKIYFSTGIDSTEANRRAKVRSDFLFQRRGVRLLPERHVYSDETRAIKKATGLIYLGNARAGETYDWFENRIGLNNANYALPYVIDSLASYEDRRQSFLYFAGRGNLHKGLDLLIDAFAETNLRLVVCQDIQPEFKAQFDATLRCNPNIELHGFVEMRSRVFQRLAASCAWTISASCSEGQPGSVLECMLHGLLPVVTESNNIDLDGFGRLLPEADPESIRAVCVNVSQTSADAYHDQQERMMAVLKAEYSSSGFVAKFEQAVTRLGSNLLAPSSGPTKGS